MKGAAALSTIRDGDPVLISEGCSHHRQCGDIGTEKLPRWIREFTGAEPSFSFTSGAGALEYLTGRSFTVENVPFAARYFPGVL